MLVHPCLPARPGGAETLHDVAGKTNGDHLFGGSLLRAPLASFKEFALSLWQCRKRNSTLEISCGHFPDFPFLIR